LDRSNSAFLWHPRGIHGTPEPKNISKTQSHGCIRLTNWDALDLAGMVRRGTLVKFEDEDIPVVPLSTSARATGTQTVPPAPVRSR
jgi:hypothetical protein